MPFYRFHFDVDAPPQTVVERLRSIVRDKLSFKESLRRMWPFGIPVTAPFIGSVSDDWFKIHRDIRYRNSFLPMIRGRVTPNGFGSRVDVTMSLHPLVGLFMIFWLGGVGLSAFAIRSASSVIPVGMFIFGAALTAAGFFPEAMKAKQLISNAANESALTPDVRFSK